MKVTFFCKKHELQLKGHPLWDLIDENDDVYTISFRDMHCPEMGSASSLLNKCSESNWDYEVE